jgi:hypothetical protein
MLRIFSVDVAEVAAVNAASLERAMVSAEPNALSIRVSVPLLTLRLFDAPALRALLTRAAELSATGDTATAAILLDELQDGLVAAVLARGKGGIGRNPYLPRSEAVRVDHRYCEAAPSW